MPSISRRGVTYHGVSVVDRGVFTNKHGAIYAGQHMRGYACGLGVITDSSGHKEYAEHGPDGECDGRYLLRWADGNTAYRLYERGSSIGWASVYADGRRCLYNGVDCAPDDQRLLALIAQVAPVEVRPAAPAPQPATQTPSDRPMDQPARFAPAGAREDRCHRGAPPRTHAVGGGRATQP